MKQDFKEQLHDVQDLSSKNRTIGQIFCYHTDLDLLSLNKILEIPRTFAMYYIEDIK